MHVLPDRLEGLAVFAILAHTMQLLQADRLQLMTMLPAPADLPLPPFCSTGDVFAKGQIKVANITVKGTGIVHYYTHSQLCLPLLSCC